MKIYVDKNALQDYTTKLIAKEKTIFATKNEVGSPLVAATVAEMTDQNRIYVYTGSETGYTSGNWYYYDGSAWVSGGIYNSEGFELDDTLTSSTLPAQAKAVGDKCTELKSELDYASENLVNNGYTSGFYMYINGTHNQFNQGSNPYTLDLVRFDIKPNTKYRIRKLTSTVMRAGTTNISAPAVGDYLTTVVRNNTASLDPLELTSGPNDTYLYIQLWTTTDSAALKNIAANVATLQIFEVPQIDPVPVDGSQNAVSSGGVYDSVSDCNSKIADTQNELTAFENLSALNKSYVYPAGESNAYVGGTKRAIWPDVVPGGAVVKNIIIQVVSVGASPAITIELWDLGADGDTLTKTWSKTFTDITANANNTFEINSYSKNARYIGYYAANAQTYYGKNMTGYSWLYISDVTSLSTLSLSALGTYTGMTLVGTIDFITGYNFDFFSGYLTGNVIVFGDSTVDGSSTTGHNANVIGTDRTAENEPNAFTSVLEGMIRTFNGSSVRVYNAGFHGKTLDYIAENYSDIMAAYPNVNSALLVIDANSANGTRTEYREKIRKGLERLLGLLMADGIACAVASPQPMFFYTTDDNGLPAINSAGEFAIAVNIGKDICKKYNIPFINLGEITNAVMESPYLNDTNFYGDRIHFGDGGHKFEAYELYGEMIHPIIYFDGTEKYFGVESNRCELSDDSGISANLVGGYRSIVLSNTNTRTGVLARYYIISKVPFKIKGIAVSGWVSYYDVFVNSESYTSNTVDAGAEIPAGAYEITIKPTGINHIVRFSGIVVTQ